MSNGKTKSEIEIYHFQIASIYDKLMYKTQRQIRAMAVYIRIQQMFWQLRAPVIPGVKLVTRKTMFLVLSRLLFKVIQRNCDII